jgi:bacterioferritin
MSLLTEPQRESLVPGGCETATANRLALLEGLNHDLAREYQAVLMYSHFSARLTGPNRQELRTLFQAEIRDELVHAQFLADKITALEGDPVTIPDAVPKAQDNREMLVCALMAEKQAIAEYGDRIRQSDEFGDVGLKVALENLVADETRHKEELERILAGWNDLHRERNRDEDRWQNDACQG